MADEPIQYKRLPGTGFRREGNALITTRRLVARVWLGPDHLLLAERSWGVENYKRFNYRDIQAVIVRRTKKATAVTILLAIPAVFFLLTALAVGDVGRWVCGIIGAAFSVFTVINAVQGASCVTHIKTAVQLEELAAWQRMKATNRGIAALRERALAAQGTLAAGEITTRLETLTAQQAQTPAAREARNLATPIKPYRGWSHSALFWLLLLEGAVMLFRIPFNSTGAVVANAVLTTAVFGMQVFALLQQGETDLASDIKKVTWISAIIAGVQLFVGYIYLVAYAAKHPGYGYNQWEMWKNMGASNTLEHTDALLILAAFGGSKVVLGLLGRLKMTRQPAPPPPTAPPIAPSGPPILPTAPPIIAVSEPLTKVTLESSAEPAQSVPAPPPPPIIG
jgi:hypothetical protein